MLIVYKIDVLTSGFAESRASLGSGDRRTVFQKSADLETIAIGRKVIASARSCVFEVIGCCGFPCLTGGYQAKCRKLRVFVMKLQEDAHDRSYTSVTTRRTPRSLLCSLGLRRVHPLALRTAVLSAFGSVFAYAPLAFLGH